MDEGGVDFVAVEIVIDPAARARELAAFLADAGVHASASGACVTVPLPAWDADARVELEFAVAAWAQASQAAATVAPRMPTG